MIGQMKASFPGGKLLGGTSKFKNGTKNLSSSVYDLYNSSLCKVSTTLVPEVFLDFSSRKRSRANREAATTSRESDEEREKNLWLPRPRISLSC